MQNLLATACDQGDLKKINFLLAKGADINFALLWSCQRGYFKVVEYLFLKLPKEMGDVNMSTILSFFASCQKGYLEIVKLFVTTNKAYVDIGFIAIEGASKNGYFEVVKYLASKGGDTSKCTEEHQKRLLELRIEYRFWKKWRRFLLRRWATRLLPVFYHPDSVGGKRDKTKIQNEFKL